MGLCRTASRFFANVYRNAFDHFVKRRLKAKWYLRYHRVDHIRVRRRIVNKYKAKKARYLEAYERSGGRMGREEIKRFLSVQAAFKGHIKHADSYRLWHNIGVIDEKDPFSFDDGRHALARGLQQKR